MDMLTYFRPIVTIYFSNILRLGLLIDSMHNMKLDVKACIPKNNNLPYTLPGRCNSIINSSTTDIQTYKNIYYSVRN